MSAPGHTLDLPLAANAVASEVVAATSRESGWKINVRLRNVAPVPVGFKAKTNAPRRWAVRPNGGVLAPGEAVVVSLSLLHAASLAVDVEDDRHLILSVPLSEDDAAALREERERHGRTSLLALHQDSPLVSQTRIVPQLVDEAVGPLFAGAAGRAEPAGLDASFQSPSLNALVTPMQSPGSARSVATDPRHMLPPPTLRKGLSVAQRVAELHRIYPDRELTVGLASPSGASSRASSSDGGDRPPRSGLQGLLRLLSGFLSSAAGEFSPWLSWKLYDVLFALTLLVLGRRLKWVRAAQEALDL